MINHKKKLKIFLVTKTLCLIWDPERDEFSFNAREEVAEWCTKHQILSALAKVYDPLGFLTAYLMLGKILIQEIWMNGTDWDVEISEPLKIRAQNWVEQQKNLDKIRVKRTLIEKGGKIQIHVFCDASKDAYGAVSYIREIEKNDDNTNIIAAKGKVCPTKTVSIP